MSTMDETYEGIEEQKTPYTDAARLLADRDAEIRLLRSTLDEIAEGEADTDHQQHCFRWRKLARAALERYR